MFIGSGTIVFSRARGLVRRTLHTHKTVYRGLRGGSRNSSNSSNLSQEAAGPYQGGVRGTARNIGTPLRSINNGGGGLLKPLAFTTMVGTTGLVTAAYLDKEGCYSSWAGEMISNPGAYWKQREVARRQDAYGKMRAGFHGTVEEIRLAWRGLSNVQQIMVSFTVAHAAVWLLWKIPAPAVQRFVERFFCHEPMSGRLVQLVGCSVSHQSFVHMGLNTMVLWSFATPMVAALGVNQYLGFSLAAACSSATFSQIHSVLRRNPRGGLGASGILMGLIALTTVLHPEGQMHIIFLPAATISAPMALAGIMTLDVCGLLLGWQIFGHAAHLGGAVFGLAYGMLGMEGYKRLSAAFA